MAKRLLKMVFVYFTIFGFYKVIFAGECTNSMKNELSKISSNIKFSLEYKDGYFYPSVTGMNPVFYITDILNNNYGVDNDGNFVNYTGGKYLPGTKFYYEVKPVYGNKCFAEVIIRRSYTVPYYNKYYDSELCKGLNSCSYCSKFVYSEYDDMQMESYISKCKKSINGEKSNNSTQSNNEFKIWDWIIDYYRWIFYPLIIVGTTLIVLIKKGEKKI